MLALNTLLLPVDEFMSRCLVRIIKLFGGRIRETVKAEQESELTMVERETSLLPLNALEAAERTPSPLKIESLKGSRA